MAGATKKVTDYIVERKALLECADFVRRHPYAVLLSRDAGDANGNETASNGAERTFTNSLEPSLGAAGEETVVMPLIKRPGAAFVDKIGVGRTRATDIQIADAGVSKYHAFFTWSEDGETYWLTDASSKNGTYVDGQRLAAREAHVVKNRSMVRIANHLFRFVSPAGFWRLLGEIAYGRGGMPRPHGASR